MYARVSVVNKEWLDVRRREAGLSLADIVDALITDAREANVTFRAHPPQVVR